MPGNTGVSIEEQHGLFMQWCLNSKLLHSAGMAFARRAKAANTAFEP
jgi:hypothetical protein